TTSPPRIEITVRPHPPEPPPRILFLRPQTGTTLAAIGNGKRVSRPSARFAASADDMDAGGISVHRQRSNIADASVRFPAEIAVRSWVKSPTSAASKRTS